MAITIESLDSLQNYLLGVLNRAQHHAGNVEGVALALLGAIVWKSTGEISVREYAGRPANMIWFYVNANKYVLTYNHNSEAIELKDRAHTGKVIDTFNNNSSYQDIINIFNALG